MCVPPYFFITRNNKNRNNMLYINGQHIDLGNDKTDYKFAKVVADFRKTIEGLRAKYGNVTLFKTIYEPRRDDLTKVMRPHKPITISYKSNVPNPETGLEKWVYSPEGATIKDGLAIPTEACFIVRFGSVSLDLNENADFVYYLTKTSHFRKGRVFIYDENAKQDALASQREREARLTEIIYSPSSKLSDLDVLKDVCRTWGIGSVETKTAATLKNLLFSTIQTAEDQKRRQLTGVGLDEFISDMNDELRVQVGSDIQSALDKGLLTFSKQTNEWLLVVEKGQAPWVITRVDGLDTARSRDILIEYFLRNPNDYKKLDRVISGDAHISKGQIVEGAPQKDEDSRVILLNEDNIMKEEDYGLLQKAYSHYGLGKPIGKSKDFLRENLLEHFAKQASEVS